MERRKFMIGIGSLAAGGAAATGTGALSQVQATRAVDVGIENDSDALLEMNVSGSSLENTEYASYENGSIQLQFDDLNPDAINDFDNIFQVLNQGQDDLKLKIDKSNLDNPDDITIYAHQTNGDLIGSRDTFPNPQINSGYGVNIGFRVSTPDAVDESWETGYIVVEASDESDANVGN